MPNQDLRLRRKVVTTGEQQPKSRLGLILSVAAAAIILPALAYTALHPANVSNTVHQLAKHFPSQVKDIRIAIRAARETPTPLPTPAATPTAAGATPAAKTAAAKAADALAAEHLAHLRRAHALAVAAHAKRLAASGQTSSDLNFASVTNSNPVSQTMTPATAAPAPAPATPTPTPAQVAAAGPPQVPISEATPLYAPEIVVDARFTREVHPDYPEVAKAQNASGTAVVLATIGPNGNVLSARIDQSTGNRLLDSAALQAARASGFEPPKINGKPATETYRLIYTFSL
ncbi:MAG TPA: energy transducer TonB [Candidatus Eremiobacteraceae bacterium]|nr:energy transducer TonB [Candidatus Eremiobacteraceae bacterium]